jgi:hypothetical protein
LAAAALLAAGCETAFVGHAPGGRYELVEVNGDRLPVAGAGACPIRIESGYFNLDAVARRFEMVLRQSGSCIGSELRESGTYLRSGPALDLEAASGARIAATQSGGTISLTRGAMRLRFRQAQRAR